MKTLKLFNAVIAKESENNDRPFISKEGFIIEKDALWAKDKIEEFYTREQLSGNNLNKTFHKSWDKIKTSTRFELYVEQIQHYISTYGSNFKSEIYIPSEVLDVPDLKLVYKVIKAYTVEEMTEKCLSLLQSGIALKEETIDDILSILVDELQYEFTGKEQIKNKEAIVKIADVYQVYPESVVEFFRYIIYRTTDTTLLIKNEELIQAIKDSSYNPSIAFNKFGLERLAEIFNRFKPLFLAYKNRAPKTINKISKLSKKYHKPLTSNPLNEVTYSLLLEKDIHWLDNATPFALFKALSACYIRKNGQDTFMYRIRNGKSWVKPGRSTYASDLNYDFLLAYLKNRFNLSEQKIFIPKDIEYALPTSEKMYVGNIPTGTKFYGEKLAVGVYWENKWGAYDLDLSGINIGGKVGWNSTYKQGNGDLMYSGDITDAPNGAVEYLYANTGLNAPTLVNNNVYSGRQDCDYKIIVGRGDGIKNEYMMNPNKLFVDIKCNSVQKQTILGMIIPEENQQSFVLLNFGAGHARVSGNSEISDLATKALYQQWNNPLTFEAIVDELSGELVTNREEATYDFSLEVLEKDSFIKIFNENEIKRK
ncbi:hypothetical protein [uncultured Tenacibaculum sp.]|uniref:hypothetical protein n=1 Tax=uncultured Tenacibaculum sp. TaxID=174713 RepID=UPI00262A8342|nr:hypothetical protein [uncultured Tenacibaculum sp.]